MVSHILFSLQSQFKINLCAFNYRGFLFSPLLVCSVEKSLQNTFVNKCSIILGMEAHIELRTLPFV